MRKKLKCTKPGSVLAWITGGKFVVVGQSVGADDVIPSWGSWENIQSVPNCGDIVGHEIHAIQLVIEDVSAVVTILLRKNLVKGREKVTITTRVV